MSTMNQTQLANALIDGELELGKRLEMEAQMREDPVLAREVGQLGQLREAIREAARYHHAPAALRARIMASIGVRRPQPAPTGAPLVAAVRRWLDWRPLAASLGAVAVLTVAVNLASLHAAQDGRLLDEVVASHVRSTLGQHLVDVESSDHHTVKPWLSSKLDFSPPADELGIPGSAFLGGRVDYLDGRPVAALVYRQGQHVVNAFVWPTSANDSEPRFAQERGFQTAHWSSGGMTHWVISDVNPQEFETVVGALRGRAARQ